MRPLVITTLIAAILLSACSAPEPEAVPAFDPAYVRAAEELCPIMWGWQRSVGAAMNDMSSVTREETDPDRRRALYLGAADRIRELNAQLDATMVSLGTEPPLDRIVPDVREGIEASTGLLVQYEEIVDEIYAELSTPGYREVVPVLFLNVEKVIDVAKPEMSTYDDEELIDAFITVPQCHVGVKDAADGTARYIP